MSGVAWIVVWWLVFGASHMLIASKRSMFIDKMGRQPYLLFYSLVSFATFIPLVMVYLDNRHTGGLLWAAPVWLQYLGMGLSLLGIAVVPAAALRSSPIGMIPRKAEARGLIRITRHPLFMGFGIWGLGHCLINGFLSDVLFFGGFALFAIIGCAHQDARKRAQDGQRLGELFATTSLLPFAAILGGRNRLVMAEMPWLLLAIGLALAVLLYSLHPVMFS